MPIDASNLTPQFLQVTLTPQPVAGINPQALRQIFADVMRFEFDTFAQGADGGAIISNPRTLRNIIINGVSRTVQVPVNHTLPLAIDEITEIFRVIETRMPIPIYLLFQCMLTSHLHVRGETAQALLDRRAFTNVEAYNALGPGRFGTGFKVFLAGTGQIQLVVEPLLEDTGRLFVQYVQGSQLQFPLAGMQPLLESVSRYHDNQIREFLNQLLGAE